MEGADESTELRQYPKVGVYVTINVDIEMKICPFFHKVAHR